MESKKHFLKSVTIWSQIICFICVLFLANAPKPLEEGFTTDELCDWAIAIGRGQKVLFICMIIVSCNLIGIYGRLRAKKGIGK
jgi:hypothetical protein